MDIGDWVQAVSSAVLATSAAIAAWQGVKGLSNWRKEAVGRRRLELAEDALINFYKVEEAIQSVRSPFSWAGETDERAGRDDETDKQRHLRDKGYVPLKRLQDNGDLFSEFLAQRHHVKAVFGAKFEEPYEQVRKCLSRIRAAGMTLMRADPDQPRDPKFTLKLEAEIWEGMGEVVEEEGFQPIEETVREAIEKAEKLFEQARK